jgi:hypothetical protein
MAVKLRVLQGNLGRLGLLSTADSAQRRDEIAGKPVYYYYRRNHHACVSQQAGPAPFSIVVFLKMLDP